MLLVLIERNRCKIFTQTQNDVDFTRYCTQRALANDFLCLVKFIFLLLKCMNVSFRFIRLAAMTANDKKRNKLKFTPIFYKYNKRSSTRSKYKRKKKSQWNANSGNRNPEQEVLCQLKRKFPFFSSFFLPNAGTCRVTHESKTDFVSKLDGYYSGETKFWRINLLRAILLCFMCTFWLLFVLA